MEIYQEPTFQFLMTSSGYKQFPVSLFGEFDLSIISVSYSSTVTNTPSVISIRSNVLQSPYSPLVGFSFPVNASSPIIGNNIEYTVKGVYVNGNIDFTLYDNTAGSFSSSLLSGTAYCLITVRARPNNVKNCSPNAII